MEEKITEAVPQKIRIRGARVHNLKNIDVDVPLNDKLNPPAMLGRLEEDVSGVRK